MRPRTGSERLAIRLGSAYPQENLKSQNKLHKMHVLRQPARASKAAACAFTSLQRETSSMRVSITQARNTDGTTLPGGKGSGLTAVYPRLFAIAITLSFRANVATLLRFIVTPAVCPREQHVPDSSNHSLYLMRTVQLQLQ